MFEAISKANIYQQYAYSYPHKHAYRPFEARPLKEVWEGEDMSQLFAYLHLPYCEMRCGFCNLFTVANPKQGVGQYLQALQREAATYRRLLPDCEFEEYAIGGGTPTFLEAEQLRWMLTIFQEQLGVDTKSKYGSIEASPKSIDHEKISLIEEFGINRISMGLQSWLESETKLLGRPQKTEEAATAVDLLKQSKVQEFNLDLIYGIKSQTISSFRYSIERCLEYAPTEIYLYPLYTRALTGLSKMQQQFDDTRLDLYRFGRDFLLEQDYRQVSMRCFRRIDAPQIESNFSPTENGTMGIGAGARSYTQMLHYSTDYAVSRKATKAIIESYAKRSEFELVNYGIQLNENEQLRHFLIKSLCDGGSLDKEQFALRFGKQVGEEPLLQVLFQDELLVEKQGKIRLNEAGMELEDAIGPMLFSQETNSLMEAFELS